MNDLKLSHDEIEALRYGAMSGSTRIIDALSDDISSATGSIAEIREQLAQQSRKLDKYIADQEAKQRYDDAQRVLDAKKQRRQEWLIAIASAALATVFPFILKSLKELLFFVGNFFH